MAGFNNGTMLSRYETWELDALLSQIEKPDPWLLRTFFPRVKMFETRTIEFDLLDRGRRLAPFVSPMVSGKPMLREGFRTRQLSPAYIKPTGLVQPSDSFTRVPGEAYGGQLSPQARFDRLVAEELMKHDDMLTNRLEWMAASALVYGQVAITGDDYPTQLVQFGRDPNLNIVLAGASRWTQATSNPMQDIQNASLLVRRISKGAIVTDLVMDGTTWDVLRANAGVQNLINIFFRNHAGTRATEIDQGPRTTLNEAQYVGTLNGRLDMWVYDSYFQDDFGNDQPFIPPYTMLGIAKTAIEGTQYFGAILDLDAGIAPSRLFSKSKMKFDPSGLEIISQSAPLVAPKRPNAMFTIDVGP